MNEICEIVPSQRGKNKINVYGYLMVNDNIKGNKYYWCCERKHQENCKYYGFIIAITFIAFNIAS